MKPSKALLKLLALGLLCLGILFAVSAATFKPIAQAEEFAKSSALVEILKDIPYDNNPINSQIRLTPIEAQALNVTASGPLYMALLAGKPQVILIPIRQPKGYSGPIDLWVGLFMDASIAGVRVNHHRETPGLGGKIDISASPWILGFKGKTLAFPTAAWSSHKNGGEFDQIAGATITSNGVINAVRQAQLFFADHKTELLTRLLAERENTAQKTNVQGGIFPRENLKP